MSLGVPDPAILSLRSGSFRSAPAAFMHGHVRTAAASFANIVQQVPCHLTLCTIALVDDRLFLFTYPPFPPYLVDISGTAVLLSESPRRPCGNRRGAAVPKSKMVFHFGTAAPRLFRNEIHPVRRTLCALDPQRLAFPPERRPSDAQPPGHLRHVPSIPAIGLPYDLLFRLRDGA